MPPVCGDTQQIGSCYFSLPRWSQKRKKNAYANTAPPFPLLCSSFYFILPGSYATWAYLNFFSKKKKHYLLFLSLKPYYYYYSILSVCVQASLAQQTAFKADCIQSSGRGKKTGNERANTTTSFFFRLKCSSFFYPFLLCFLFPLLMHRIRRTYYYYYYWGL